jgi:Icc-related predicted phosphoesterase
MILFYAADMHGSEQVWRKFVNAAKFYGVDNLILGGDITGKILVPVVEEKPGHFVAQIFGKAERVKRQDDLEELEKRLRFNGYYPYRCTPDEYQKLAADSDYRMDVMRRQMVDTVHRWVEIADEKLAGTQIHLYAMAGNDDDPVVDEELHGDHVTNVESQVVRVGEYQLLSSAWGNPSPWDTPREKEESELLVMFEDLATRLETGIPAIFNLHIPPYDSGLDTGPEVAGKDSEGQVIVKKIGGQPQQAPVGSKAVRTLIEEYQPALGLHSHIHESKNARKIGRTLCINPGSSYQDGVLDGAIVELEGDSVVRYQLVSG